MKYGLSKELKKHQASKYMPELNKKEKGLYKIVQSYMNTQKEFKKIPEVQRPIFYQVLANVYANIASILEKKDQYKEEASLFKKLALKYAQNAVNYANHTKNLNMLKCNKEAYTA